MKTLLTFLFSFVLMTSFSQENKYEQAMLNAIAKMNSSVTINEFLDVANSFERISQSAKAEWIPLYHAAFAYIVIGFQEQDVAKKDPYLDKAQQFLDRAFKIAPEESELIALQAFLYPARIMVDPMTRGMEFMGKMNAALDLATQKNPENPRSYYLRAVSLLNMPESFGGGAAVAKPLFETAKRKFDNFQPLSPISPNWGKEQNEAELGKL
jgi:hypothetical protein